MAPSEEPQAQPQEITPEQANDWADTSNKRLEESEIPKRVVDVNKGQKVYGSFFHNFLLIFFVLILITGLIFGMWGIYNDKFKTEVNTNLTCPDIKIPECPRQSDCNCDLTCPAVNTSCVFPDRIIVEFEGNQTN